MRLHLHGMDPSKCKPGDTGKWEMLEDAAEARQPGAATPPPAPAATPVRPKGKANPALDYLKAKK